MKNMVRKAASKKMAEQATDMKADPGYADLYVPRKSGDPTGQSKVINETLAPGLSAETSGPETEQVNAQIRQPASPIQLGAPTKFSSVPITNGLRTAGANIPGKPQMDIEAYWMGLFDEFRDPMIAEYLTNDTFVAPRVEKVGPLNADTETT
tara:strand:- start:336 stop:791 length:456 start_codon:yes stop_codon:yes gene_type:complete